MRHVTAIFLYLMGLDLYADPMRPSVSITASQSQALLTWQSEPDVSYQVQSKVSLTDPWQNAGASISGNGATACFVDVGYTNDGSAWQNVHAAAYFQPSIGETWTNFSAWNNSHLITSNGAVYADGSGANPSAANRAFVIPAAADGRVVSTITIPPNDGSSVVVVIGVSSDSPGGAPDFGASSLVGIGIAQNAFGTANTSAIFWNHGPALTDTNILAPGTYTIELSVDASYVSLALICPGHTNEFVKRVTRASAGDVNNLQVFISDRRGLNGFRVNALGARAAQETIGNRIGEGTADFVIFTSDNAGGNISIRIPPFYDSRFSMPVFIHCHGYGAYGYMDPWGTFPYWTSYFQQIINSGYIVVAGDFTGNNWGNQAGVDSVQNAVDYVRAHFNCGPLVIEGMSMGGATSLNYIHQHKADVSAWVGLFPVCSLYSMWAAHWTNEIGLAYGIASTNDYAADTAGHDPILFPSNTLQSVPMLVIQNTNDGTVNFFSNALPFMTIQSNWEPTTILTPAGDGHGPPSVVDAPSVLSFLSNALPLGINQQRFYRLVATSRSN